MENLTQKQIYKIRKDFIKKMRDIDGLKISDEGKIRLVVEFLEGYKRGFESAGTIFDIKEVDIVYSIDSGLAMFDKHIGQVEPSIGNITLIASSCWEEIIKIMKKIDI